MAEKLERYLGDPHDERNALSFAQAVALDEVEQYPERACALLDEWGLPDFYVPAVCGGRLRSYEELISLLRVVARRDFTVGFAYSILSLLGSAATWVGGTDCQKQKVAQLLKERKQIILAYNEKAHGGDFMATGVKAVKVDGGYQLSGEKWLIGNAVRCAAMTVMARTRDEAGPRSLSLFLVEKNALDPRSFEHLPRIKTHGVRGAHVSGIKFKESFLKEDSLIGAEGTALEQTLKAFQLTRAVIPALALGAADTALRCVLDFARTRNLYGSRVVTLPQVRQTLVEAFLDLLIGDCLTTACARAVHQTPEQMRLYSAVVKYYVPQSLEETIERLGVVLGARHYLREEHWHGIFQKLLRDNVVLRYHFNAALNLTTIGVHLRDLAQHRAYAASNADASALQTRLAAVFDLNHPLADLNPNGLSLYTRGRDDFLNGLELALEQLRLLAQRTPSEGVLLQCVIALVERVLEQRQAADYEQRDVALRLGSEYSRSPELFELAERYCVLEAAACCVHLWLHNRERLSEFFMRGDWLVLSLERLLMHLGQERSNLPAEHEERVAEEMERLFEEERLFSVVPLQLAQRNE